MCPIPATIEAVVRVFARPGHPGGTRPATLTVREEYKCGPDDSGWANAVDSEVKGNFTWVPDQRCGAMPLNEALLKVVATDAALDASTARLLLTTTGPTVGT